MTYRQPTDTEILRELKRCEDRNAQGGISDGDGGRMPVDPWWERRIAYLRHAGRERLLAVEGLLQIRERGHSLTRPNAMRAAA